MDHGAGAARLKRRLGGLRMPPEYVLNHVVNRIPLVDARMAAYDRLGVRFTDRASTMFMLGTEVWNPTALEVGARSTVGRDVLLDARGGLRLGSDVNVTSHVRFMTAKHIVDDPDFTAVYDPIEVGDRAWVALGATVLGGVSIGEGAVVAAGSVVTKDVAPYAVVGGAPARVLRTRSRDLRYELGWRPNWL